MVVSRLLAQPLRKMAAPALAALAAASLLAACTATHSTAAAGGTPAAVRQGGLVVRAGDGLLQGKPAEGVRQFLGVPYAAPPTGALRWQAPQPARSWPGVRDATAYGSRCPQLASQDGPRQGAEDCLFLNVFTPAGRPGQALPVLFWIHGGALVQGAGDMYDGSLIARTDDVVVVSVNYRLDAFGFLDVPGLGTSPLTASGNYGLLDQEAALRWVRSNIAAFGGDPRRVTIAGQSAGGWAVCALLTSPPARGLFAAAIMESGSCLSRTRSQAQAIGLKFAGIAGCTDPAAAASCLRDTPGATLLTKTKGANTDFTKPDVEFTSGGPDLPLPPAQAVADGDYVHVPVLIGTNHDEARYFTQGFADYTRQQYDTFITQLYGPVASAVLRRYPWDAYPSLDTGTYALGAVLTDSGAVFGIGGCAAQDLAARFAATTPTYFYQFDDENPPAQNTTLPGFRWGAAHTQELSFLWPGWNPYGTDMYTRLTPAELKLSAQMIAWWGAFAWHGSPHVPGQPAWPAYSSRNLMSLRPGGQSHPITAATFAAQHQCAFWGTAGAAGP